MQPQSVTLDNKLKNIIFSNSVFFRKKEKTGLRKVTSEEIGQKWNTWVSSGDKVRLESQNEVHSDHIVARNPYPIGIENEKPIYNEWLVEKTVIIENYGQDVVDNLTDDFTFHLKIKTIKAVPITLSLLEQLGCKEDKLYLKVSWSDMPMIGEIGDWLCNEGYTISAFDFEKTYILIEMIHLNGLQNRLNLGIV